MATAVFGHIVERRQIDEALRRLVAAGVPRGGIVAWLALNRWEMLAMLAACEELGVVLMPLNWRLATTELVMLVEHAQAHALLHDDALAEEGAVLRRTARWHAGPADGVREGDLLLVYTSGTTGEPKGALHTATGMLANAEAAIEAQGLNAATRALATLPLFHVGGLCIQTLPTLLAGGEVQLQPRFESGAWFDAVEQWRPTTTLLVPAVMRALIEHPRWSQADLSSLNHVAAGSQIVPRALIDAFHDRGVPVAQVYGSTETGPVSLVVRPQEARAHADMSGRAARGVRVRLGTGGEVLLQAAHLMRTYHRSANPPFDAEGYFATGDLAVGHADGWYRVVGRSKELIISGGENIHPGEIEELLVGWPGVAEAAVIGVPDTRWGEVPVLALVPEPGATIDEAALHRHLASRLARFKLPRRVLLLDRLPRTALGKVQRGAIAVLISQGQATAGTP